jgi:hypothetical protein
MAPGVTRDQVVAKFKSSAMSDEAWDLIKTGVISNLIWKIGERPGVAFTVTADSEQEVRAELGKSEVVKSGVLEFDVEPASPFRNF